MNKQLIYAVAMSCALAITGCMTYEGVKATMESGDSIKIAETEDEILSKVYENPTREQGRSVSPAVLADCIGLIDNDEKLLKKINERKYGYYLKEIARAIRFKSPETVVAVFKSEIYSKNDKNEYGVDHEIRDVFQQILIPNASAAMKDYKYDILKSIYDQCKDVKSAKVRDEVSSLAMRIADMSNETQALELLKKEKFPENAKRILFSKLTKNEDKLQFKNDVAFIDLFEKEGLLTEAEIVNVKLNNQWRFNANKIAKDLKDKKLFVECIVRAKDMEKFWTGPWEDLVSTIKTSEEKQCIFEEFVSRWAELKKDNRDWYKFLTTFMQTEEEKIKAMSLIAARENKLTEDRFEIFFNADTSSSFVDAVYDNPNIEWKPFVTQIEEMSSMLSEAKKASLEENAMKRLKSAEGNKVMFLGTYYIGMPFVDFLLLKEKHAQNISGICYDYEKNNGVKHWWEEAYVTRLEMPISIVVSDLQCEDSEVLYYMIHRYVMNKSGKAYGYEYAQLTEMESDTIAHSSFMGTRYEHRTWHTYTNSRSGIKIWVDTENGIVRVTKKK